MEELEDFKPRKIVKLSKAQLKDVKTEEKSSVVYSSTVHIQYCGAELEVASENLMSVLATIRAVNGLVQ